MLGVCGAVSRSRGTAGRVTGGLEACVLAYGEPAGRRRAAVTLSGAAGAGRLTAVPGCPGWDVALGSVAGRRWQPPPGLAVARPGRHFAPGPVPGIRGDGQAWP